MTIESMRLSVAVLARPALQFVADVSIIRAWQ